MNSVLLVIALVAPVSFLLGIVSFIIALNRIQATVTRIETAAKIVAVDLADTAADLRVAATQRTTMAASLDRIEAGDQVVADNLASSVSRADATVGPEGAAADAALRTGDTAEAITARQDQTDDHAN